MHLILGIAEDESVLLTFIAEPLALAVAFNVGDLAVSVYVKVDSKACVMLAVAGICNVFLCIFLAVCIFIIFS